MLQRTSAAIDPHEIAALKLLALEGGLAGDVKVSCSELATRLDASTQTASRRLQALESAGLIEREIVSDGQWVRVADDGEFVLRREHEAYRRLFEASDLIDLRGTVSDGMGEGKHYITLDGYMRQFQDRLGYEPFAGTLNVELTPDSVRQRSGMESLEPIPIDGWANDERTYGPATCYPATVETDDGRGYEPAHVIAPERTHHDEDKLELIAPEKLRDVLELTDGDHLLIHVEGR